MSQYLSVLRSTHYATVLCILRYLKGTLFHDLFYSAQSSLVLRAFSDADWVGDLTDHRSTTGYYFLLGSSLISWRSKKQTHVARSSTEAEYRALTDTTSELLWLRWLLKDLGVSTSSATPLYCDNQSAIYIAHNDVLHKRTKTSRSIVILSVIILSMVLSSWSQSLLKINLQISSPSHILRDVFVLWLTTSSWSHIHLEFEGGC